MAKSLIKIPGREVVKAQPIEKFVRLPKTVKKGLAFPKAFKALVITDKANTPKYFVFDAASLWDLVCVFDENFERFAPSKAYVNHNPFGWMIDALEAHFPLNSQFVRRLKKGIQRAGKLGLVPFSRIKRQLDLN